MILNRTLQGLLIKQAGVSDYLKKALIGGLIGGGLGGTAGGILGNKLWSGLYDARRRATDLNLDDLPPNYPGGPSDSEIKEMAKQIVELSDHHADSRMAYTGTPSKIVELEPDSPGAVSIYWRPGGGGIIPEVKGTPSRLPFLGAGAGVLAGGLGGLGYQAIQDLLTKE